MNYRSFNLEDWIDHLSGVIEDESTLDGNEMRDLVEFLSKLPKWLPVSERPPELNEPVLTFDGRCMCVERRIEWVETSIGPLYGEWWINGNKGDECKPIGLRYGTAIAWMPLPKPYKAESEE